MPRKPKLPMPTLHIEGLSGSAPIIQPQAFVDDFSSEVIAMKPEAAQASRKYVGPLKRRQRLAHKAMQRQALTQTPQAQAEAAQEFITQRMQPTLRSPAKPGEQSITLGPDLVIIVPAKPWRRL